jgi:hypothetical protein
VRISKISERKRHQKNICFTDTACEESAEEAARASVSILKDIIIDDRLQEFNFGELERCTISEYHGIARNFQKLTIMCRVGKAIWMQSAASATGLRNGWTSSE